MCLSFGAWSEINFLLTSQQSNRVFLNVHFQLAKRQRGDADDDTIRKAPTRDVDPEKCHGDDAETSSSDDEHTDKGATPKTLTAEELAQVRENIRARQKAGMVRTMILWLQGL